MSNRSTGKIKTEWDLSQLYKSPKDPLINKDISKAEKACAVFVKKYKKDGEYLKNESALFKALSDYEKLSDIPSSKGFFYLRLSQDLDSRNEIVRAESNLVLQRLQKLGNTLLFFEIGLSKVPILFQKKFLESKKLTHYRYFLKKIFENGKFVLTEPEEKILSLKSLPSHGLWTDAVEKMRNKQTLKHKGKQISVSEASFLIKDLPTQKERAILHNKMLEQYYSIADMAESEINAIITDKKINDELRGFLEPYDSTILAYENNKKSVLNLVKTVTLNFHVAHRFYDIKAKALNLKKLLYSDRAVSIGRTKKKILFTEACKNLVRILTSVDREFGEILKDFIKNGQIDAYPKVGKHGGAYCAPEHNSPTFVLLNHVDTFDSLMTFGHEMGHAIHAEFSKSQGVLYEGHSMSTAEVASTLFELFVFYDEFQKLTESEKVVALHDKIQDDVQTIFRQIACFNFEAEMHNTIRKEGNMSKEKLAECMNKHMKSYLGKTELSEKDGYFFVGWPHIRNFFYVYSYAFGQLASKALYQKYKEDKSYIREIKKFLSTGSSMSPENIFKSIGVDVTKPDFWQKGIENIEEDVILLESLANKKINKK